MARVRAATGLRLVNAKGKGLGYVEYVLFHPQEPRVVGFQVTRPRFLYLIDRKPLFVPLSDVRLGTERLDARDEKIATGTKAARKLGLTWEQSVIWTGMPVRTRSGKRAGTVFDAQFAEDTGEVTKLVLTEGVTSDVAVGRRSIEGHHVRGFDGEAVAIEDVLQSVEFTGGAAATAGRSAAVAKKAATETAKKVVAAGKASAKVAGESEIGKRTIGAFKGFFREMKDAMNEDEKQ